jgi:GNAT superfamily N-acetyltransferase
VLRFIPDAFMDIDFFRPADAVGLAPLLEEMQAYYSVFCPPREAIVATLNDLPPGVEILLARVEGRIVGFAGFGANYAGPGLKPGLFLKDLYVTKSERGKSIGKALMARIAAIAVERGYTRVDWTASRSDEKLIRFYNSLGASMKEDRVFFRLDGDGLKALAQIG